MIAGGDTRRLEHAHDAPRADVRHLAWEHEAYIFDPRNRGSCEHDDFLPLRRTDIRLKSPWRRAWSRLGRGRRGTRHLIIMTALVTLTAACAAVKSTPEEPRTPALASNDVNTSVTTITPLPKWRPLRPSRATESAAASAETLTPARQPHAETRQATLEERPDLWQSPRLFEGAKPGRQRALTELVSFGSAPFPYDGNVPQGGPFLDVAQDGQRGHRTRRGQVLWESTTFNDRRVLVHIPAGFDPSRPAVLVVFFHGFGATLTRDVLARQEVPAQISASGANAILLAPQFAVDARDASAGRFWERGGFSRFLSEASHRLADLQGDPATQGRFAKMPVVLVAYSGGFLPAAWSLKDIEATKRVRGVLLLDAAYGELERFANYAASNKSSFLVSAYTRFTERQNAELASMVTARGVSADKEISGSLSKGGAIFLSTGSDASHTDYVTQAWTGDPIKDVLTRLPEFWLHEPRTMAAVDTSVTPGLPDDSPGHQ